ncbi:MAG: TetR/AcrR family transcriptional regulator [Actinomycetota bacterium]
MSTGLTRDVIAEKAVETGFRDLSMSSVARALGVTHVALYRHVRDRADLGYAAADVVARRMVWPEATGDWAAHLRAVCHLVRDTFHEHPGLYDEVVRLGSVPNFDRHILGTANHLLEQGFSPHQARLAVEMMFHVVLDSVRAAESEPVATQPEVPDAILSASVTFDQKLDVLLTGLAAVVGTDSTDGGVA